MQKARKGPEQPHAPQGASLGGTSRKTSEQAVALKADGRVEFMALVTGGDEYVIDGRQREREPHRSTKKRKGVRRGWTRAPLGGDKRRARGRRTPRASGPRSTARALPCPRPP